MQDPFFCPKCQEPLSHRSPKSKWYECTSCDEYYEKIKLQASQGTAEKGWEGLPKPYDVFVGRKDIIKTLWQEWERVNRTSRPSIVVLEGEPGVGKSAVVEAFYREIAGDNIKWDAHDYWPDVPLGRLDAMADPATTKKKWKECATKLGENELKFMWYATRCGGGITLDGGKAKSVSGSHLDLGPWVNIANSFKVHKPLSKVFPSVVRELVMKAAKTAAEAGADAIISGGGLLPKAMGAIRDKFGDQEKLVERKFTELNDEVMSRVSLVTNTELKGYPTIISLDDIQWAPPRSLEFLISLLSRSKRKLLVIATARNVDIKAENLVVSKMFMRLESLAGTGFNYVNKEVPPLDSSNVSDLVTELFRAGKPAPGLCDWIVDKADGLPLFADSLSRHIVDEG